MGRETRDGPRVARRARAVLVDDADLVIRDRMSASDEFDGIVIVRPGRFGEPARVQGQPIDAVDDRNRPGGGNVTATAFSARP